MKSYLIEFEEPITLDGTKFQGIILLAFSMGKAKIRFRHFCEKYNINPEIKTIKEAGEQTYILIKDGSEYRWE